MSDENECKGDEYFVELPIQHEDGSRSLIKHCSDHTLKNYKAYPLRDGQPIAENAEIIERIPESNIYRPMKVSSSGPAKVATKKYRDGWDRIFSKDKNLN